MASRLYPALDVVWPVHPGEDQIGQLLAVLDNGTLAAVQDAPLGCRVFFHAGPDRDLALDVARRAAPSAAVSPADVCDEAWAERSQAGLTPVTVGSLVISPPWCARPESTDGARWIVIEPSMGFGTGHHQTTRLCLRLLQQLPLAGRSVLDIGTGSGVLAIAAARLGAAAVRAVDFDRDAIACATDNVHRNEVGSLVTVAVEGVGPGPHEDWDSPSLTPDMVQQLTKDAQVQRDAQCHERGAATYDVVAANLTGATLMKLSASLAAATRSAGQLIVSGFQHFEQDSVEGALTAAGFRVTDRAREDEWVATVLTAIPSGSTAPPAQSRERSQP
jgi:ribosomal protein L11 methyltransferase